VWLVAGGSQHSATLRVFLARPSIAWCRDSVSKFRRNTKSGESVWHARITLKLKLTHLVANLGRIPYGLPFHNAAGRVGRTVTFLSKDPIDASVNRTLMCLVEVLDVVRKVSSGVLRIRSFWGFWFRRKIA